jgi:D-serine deaminase-like pyridoxal phosphate-dependent protein
MPEIIRLQMKHGIDKFKCATISEAEMVASCGAKDILLAMQPVGPNAERFFKLRKEYGKSGISCIADDSAVIRNISQMAVNYGIETEVWLDVNVGMNRTGIAPGKDALDMYHLISNSPKLIAAGLHVYDGHLHEPDPALRQKLCNEAFAKVIALIENLRNNGIANVKIIAGGTPTFPVHALRKDVELSPGTLLLWDYGYSSSFSDLDFLHAAVLLTRVVSKPSADLLCLDLGHKAVASEMPQPRVKFFGIENYTIAGHNEEHMVIKSPGAWKFRTGDVLYGIPWHVCPTIDRYDVATVVIENKAVGQWRIEARQRKLSI